ncbi:hypothetical protein ACWD5R_39555 [Streptomyces sp. NPDC002514]|uniref:hypothetical protein n=1 Tax=Streptomyces sp. NPDC001270 TaxID=3364554 RepID=UPI00369564C7
MVAFTVGALLFYADAVAAFVLALLCGVVGLHVMPWWAAAVPAVAVGAAAWCVGRAVPRSRLRLEEWALRADHWISPPAPQRSDAEAKPVELLVPESTATPRSMTPARASRSTEPRPLKPYELAGWECWRCGQPAVAGTHAWEDRGPCQLLSNHTLRCSNGHRWTNSTDGG